MRPLTEPPLSIQLSLKDCIAIQNHLDEELTLLSERGELNGATSLYFVPLSQDSARLLIINDVSFKDKDKLILQRLGEKAQRMYEEKLGRLAP